MIASAPDRRPTHAALTDGKVRRCKRGAVTARCRRARPGTGAGCAAAAAGLVCRMNAAGWHVPRRGLLGRGGGGRRERRRSVGERSPS